MFNKLLKKLKEEKKTKSKQEANTKKPEKEETLDLITSPYPKKKSQNLFSQKSKIKSIYYDPNFLSEQDQEKLVNFIQSQKKKYKILIKSRRKVQKWGGDVSEKGLEKKENLPKILKEISEYFKKNNLSPIETNHVLINEYEKDSGIMPHTDGPLYYPYTIVISLLSSSILEFYKDYNCYKQKKISSSFFIEKGSLYIFENKAYKNYLHCIRDFSGDRILLKIKILDKNFKFEIIDSNIDNFFSTRIYKEIMKKDYRDLIKNEVLSYVKNNSKYDYCLDLKRDVRISLTFRQVPEIKED